jgi:hypothetical protein
MHDADLAQLAAHMRYRLSPMGLRCDARVDELTALVVRHWPHAHLEELLPDGRNHAAIPHIMRLVRAQVREQWEARHGLTPAWGTMIGDAADVIAEIVLELWWSREGWRIRLRAMTRRQGEVARAVEGF